jgi:hypothetical protein
MSSDRVTSKRPRTLTARLSGLLTNARESVLHAKAL